MNLFKFNNNSAVRLNTVMVRDGKRTLERDIQKVFEENLEELLDVSFLAH